MTSPSPPLLAFSYSIFTSLCSHLLTSIVCTGQLFRVFFYTTVALFVDVEADEYEVMTGSGCTPAGGDAKMDVEPTAAGAPAEPMAVEEDEECQATYQLTGVLTHKVRVLSVVSVFISSATFVSSRKQARAALVRGREKYRVG